MSSDVEAIARKPNQMQLMLIGLWAIQGKTPTKEEMIEFYRALIAAGKS